MTGLLIAACVLTVLGFIRKVFYRDPGRIDLQDSERFPYTTPDDSDARMFIQWKGTDVCMDFTCGCGAEGHVDDYGAYFLCCRACGSVYQLGTQVVAKKLANPADAMGRAIILDLDREY